MASCSSSNHNNNNSSNNNNIVILIVIRGRGEFHLQGEKGEEKENQKREETN